MSQSISITQQQTPIGPVGFTRVRLFATLIVKEIRETGFYGVVIMAAGVLFIAAVSVFSLSQTSWIREYSGLAAMTASLAKIFPLLIAVACGSACFAIEHENRSFHFLRALPVSIWLIFLAKFLVVACLVLLSCLIFWSIFYFGSHSTYINLATKSDYKQFAENLPLYWSSIGEAFLWSLLFSLREKRVIYAIFKSSLGFFLISQGPNLISAASLQNQDWDLVYLISSAGGRILVAVTLLFLIRRAASRWLRDPVQLATRFYSGRRSITSDRTTRYSATIRLIWLQFSANRFAIPAMALAIGGLIVASAVGNATITEIGRYSWVMIVASLGALAVRSTLQNAKFLAASGYRPRQIWYVSSATAFLFCLVIESTVRFCCEVFGFWGLDSYWIDMPFALACFSAGQFAALFCRSAISTILGAVLFSAASLFFLRTSLSLFEHQLPTFIALIFFPLTLVALSIQPLALRGTLGRGFWVALITTGGAFLIPFGLMRAYEVPDADVEAIVLEFSGEQDRSREHLLQSMKMSAARQVGDKLIELAGYVSRPELHTEAVLQVLREELRPLLEIGSDQMMLLRSSANDIQDLDRWRRIKIAYSAFWDHCHYQVKYQNPSYAQIHLGVMNHLNWNFSFGDSPLIYWWSRHPQTTKGDIRKLISRLEDEGEVLELYQAYRLARYRHQMASVETAPNTYPRVLDGGPIPKQVVILLPWEVTRFKRTTRFRFAKDWKSLQDLKRQHSSRAYGFEYKKMASKLHTDLIADYVEEFPMPDFSRLENILYDRRATRLFLALVLWQRDHDGLWPAQLRDLENGYLKEIPVSPIDGEPFYYSATGMQEVKTYFGRFGAHTIRLREEWKSLELYRDDPDEEVYDHPLLWINEGVFPNRELPWPLGKIRTPADLDNWEISSNVRYWILPKLNDGDNQ